MARFKPDPDFQIVISEAVLGRNADGSQQPVRGVGRGSVRRKRTTLQEVADDIIVAAKDIVDDEDFGLPSVGKKGQRAKGYDFRSEDRAGKTYRASFKSRVRKLRGRYIIEVVNDHPHAQDVEYGNGRGSIRVRGEGYMRLPITKAAHDRIVAEQKAKGRKPLTDFEKERARARSKLRYWEGRKNGGDLRSRRSLISMSRRAFNGGRTRLSEKQLRRIANQSNVLETGRRRARVKAEIADAKRIMSATEQALTQPGSFPARGDDGKYYLFVKEVATYRGYGILRRAMRRAVRQKLQ